MTLRAKYILIAQRLQEADDALAAGASAAQVAEAGARHSSSDQAHLQNAHDSMVALGAMCGGAKTQEAAVVDTPAPLNLVESAATTETIAIREAKADYEIKLIAPGKGSSAFYPAEVLKRDGPKVFGAGTHVYLNHPTAAEEAARPEGDVANLAGVLTTAAIYHESHAKGEGLYARMKVFADHAQMVEEKAAHVGMSIRASGIAESGTKRDGLPVLKELTRAESVDVVTHAGAGGLILQEAAQPAAQPIQEASMDAEELKLLRESLAAQQTATNELLAKERRREAIAEGASTLKSYTGLSSEQKEYIIGTVLKEALPVKEGALDTVKLAESVSAEAKRYAATMTASGRVTGMGAPAPVQIDATESARRAADAKKLHESSVRSLQELGLSETAAKAAADKLMSEEAA